MPNVPFGWSQAPVVVFCSVTFTRSTSTLSDAVPVIVTAEEPSTALAAGAVTVVFGAAVSPPPPDWFGRPGVPPDATDSAQLAGSALSDAGLSSSSDRPVATGHPAPP